MEVTFKLNVDDSEETLQKGKAAIDSFFNSLLGTELNVEVPATSEETQEPEKPKRKRRTKAEIAAEKAAKEAEEDETMVMQGARVAAPVPQVEAPEANHILGKAKVSHVFG